MLKHHHPAPFQIPIHPSAGTSRSHLFTGFAERPIIRVDILARSRQAKGCTMGGKAVGHCHCGTAGIIEMKPQILCKRVSRERYLQPPPPTLTMILRRRGFGALKVLFRTIRLADTENTRTSATILRYQGVLQAQGTSLRGTCTELLTCFEMRVVRCAVSCATIIERPATAAS